ncbi:NADH-quinone oxidoreductase subunit G [Rhodobium orientis]|uniref:NADH-quinone oxidoreductase n=1 Tax=Rhodobium orientis TaxID=34017 RepID=A0A327JQX2_9HYPH|nr:NADH-quinone oxidoreductase subunit NuoG [Rhodobium orientis]MBB4302419.1 NADH-quinone oxidoreductase subunit G [Rhodobium orientis]MBK5949270.1 NADH-quinone oxidoreductase subunit G [Rhodobium orientis]RAI28677.1 NADH-quinone oxidoreductase subunit G [Rhodobium orientis]
MPKIIVDGNEIEVPADYTLMQACEAADVEIPRFCFHERLSVAGNCRMCLVELKGAPKPVASCSWLVRDCRPGPNGELPEVKTKSDVAKKARRGVMEFLLINHPLDCPICDQGGECDLQDQAMAFGVDGSRFHENKRAVEDKYIGPLVKTIMTRCIHCTRCVRFTTEIAGVSELGLIGRGEDAEITTYLEAALTSEMQGNVIDLCPVGALTARPYAFHARPWELVKTESVDVMDGVGCAIRVDTRGREVMRILPRLNEAVNEEWISDKTRFIWDGLRTQRLDRPYVKKDGRLTPASWQEAFAAIAAKVKGTDAKKIGAISGELASAEEIFALKSLMAGLGVANTDCRPAHSPLHPASGRASYLFNTSIAGIEDADAIMLIGTNPRKEAPVLNARIRKRFLRGGLEVGLVGAKADLTYPVTYCGAGPDSIQALIDDKSYDGKAERPMVIVGEGALNRPDGAAILSLAAKFAVARGAIREDWNGFNVLHSAAATVGGLDVGFVPGEGGLGTAGMVEAAGTGDLDVLFLMGADEIDMQALGNAFVVYMGSHGDAGAHRADVILPGAAYTEKSGLYVNTEGRVQLGLRAAFPPGEAREDWAILRALSGELGAKLPFDTLVALRAALVAAHPHFALVDEIAESDPKAVEALAGAGGSLDSAPFEPWIDDFYLTNPIARASKVMAECSALAHGLQAEAAE